MLSYSHTQALHLYCVRQAKTLANMLVYSSWLTLQFRPYLYLQSGVCTCVGAGVQSSGCCNVMPAVATTVQLARFKPRRACISERVVSAQVCNHPDLFEGRPIISAFDMWPLELRVPSMVPRVGFLLFWYTVLLIVLLLMCSPS